MKVRCWVAFVSTLACAMLILSAAGAREDRAADEGKGADFKSKIYEIKEKGEITVVLSFEEGKDVTVTTIGEKETDVNLFVKGRYFEAKDISPGSRVRSNRGRRSSRFATSRRTARDCLKPA